MNDEHPESGYVDDDAVEYGLESAFTDIEILRTTDYNVVARGRRYGRWWLLKGLPPGKSESAALQRRLKKEFELHSRLRHQAIPMAVALENVGHLGLCIVMEWIEGETLSKTLDSRKLKRNERREIMRNIVAAVSYIHSMGIAHRDLKPANIMLRKSGQGIALIDFGLADSDDYAEMKQPAGTAGFISPEQMENGGTDPADDVFSLGMIMKLLCPEYKSLSRKCTAPRAQRPADAGKIAAALDRRKQRPRILFYTLIAILCVVSAILAYTVYSLSDISKAERRKVTEIAEDNSENRRKASELEDSMTTMGYRLSEAEARQAEAHLKQAEAEMRQAEAESRLAEIANHDRLKQETIKEGMRMIDMLTARYDSERGTHLSAGDAEKLMALQTELQKDFQNKLGGFSTMIDSRDLSNQEKKLINSELQNYFAIAFNNYYQKWLRKVYPTLE